MKIVFTRHEITPWNVGHSYLNPEHPDKSPIVQSWSDGPGNQIICVEDARKKGRALKGINFQTYRFSGLGRTHDTLTGILEGIGQKNGDVIADPRFRDVNYGFWDGLSLHELETGTHVSGEKVPAYAETYANWAYAEATGDLHFTLPHRLELFRNPQDYGAHSQPTAVATVIKNVREGVEDLITLDKDTLVVGHGHQTKSSILALTKGTPYELPDSKLGSIQSPNSVIYCVSLTPDFKLEHYNWAAEQWDEGFVPK